MKSLHLKLLFVIILICQAITTIASPAYPGLIKMKQPDGTTISLYLKGDEKIHWMESEDGYSLMYNNDKTIVYAISDEKGDMMPSSVAASDISMRTASDNSFLKNTQKKLRYSSAQINTLRSIWEITSQYSDEGSSQFRASVGDANAICTLINFADKPLVKSKADFEVLMNQVGYSANGAMGSVVDYYKENSYGKLNFKITVAGPYTVSKGWEYYGENDSEGDDIPARVQEFAKEAAELTFGDPNIKTSDFDNDNDGFIDAFHIIYAGYGEEAGGNANCIWAHKFGFPALTFGNKKLNVYSCSPELRGNSGNNITHIGVICHEMCHVFGAPDFYDADGDLSGGKFEGTGKWDLMAEGSWNNSGACPSHINMYQKIIFGWVNSVVLSEPQIISNMPNSAENAVAYRYDTSTSGEYFILENRQKRKFDQYIPGTGLLIYHVSITIVDIFNNTVNIKHPQKVYPVCASANTNPNGTPSSYGTISSAGCPFPGISGKTSFTDYSIPSATAWNGANTVKPLTDIREQNETISFRFRMPDAEPVTNLQANVENSTVKLTWNKPSEDVIGYNIYRNNLLIIKLNGKNNTSFSQINVCANNHSYCVTAVYPNKESDQVCKEVKVNSQIDCNNPSVLNLEAINNDKDIELKWQSPFISDWMTYANKLAGWCHYSTSSNKFLSAVRFTKDDIQKFQGSKLSKVRFSVRSTQCKHTIQVWLTDIGYLPSGDPIIDQLVNNPASPNDNFEVTLNKPVALANDKELWVCINYELNPLTSVAGIDQGPMIPERNFIFIENKWYTISSQDNFNWFISGYFQFDTNLRNASDDSWLRSTTATANNYVVYRDNVKITTTNQPGYKDIHPPYGSHIYCVAIAYDDGKESEPAFIEAFSSNNTSITPVNNLGAEINIYPNPVLKGETLVIHCDPQIVSTLSLYNISGQLIQQEQITGEVVYKKMDFERGIYLLQIKNNSNTFIRKIIIK